MEEFFCRSCQRRKDARLRSVRKGKKWSVCLACADKIKREVNKASTVVYSHQNGGEITLEHQRRASYKRVQKTYLNGTAYVPRE